MLPKPSQTLLPPRVAKSFVEKYEPAGSSSLRRNSSSANGSTVTLGATPMEALIMFTGRSASFSSAPGVRSFERSAEFTTLMPFGMNVLSPRLSTCRPMRTSSGMLAPTVNLARA